MSEAKGTRRWQRRPEGSNWGDFGPDDQHGRLNLITPERRRAALAEAREGLVFCLSLPLDLPGGNALHPLRHPPRHFAADRGGVANFDFELARLDPRHTDLICDDAVLLFTQYSTQWDALGHVGSRFDADGDGTPEHRYWNGWRGSDDLVPPAEGARVGDLHEGPRALALGVERLAETCVQGRGVLVDLHAHLGPGRTFVDHATLDRILERDRVAVDSGDILCLHTGYAGLVLEMGGRPDPEVLHGAGAVLDGRDAALLAWIDARGIAAIACDNYAVEGYPARPGEGSAHAALPLHEHCLFKLGMPLGELWYLGELAAWLRANGRSRFLLTAPPLRLPGAVGSPVTPVATV